MLNENKDFFTSVFNFFLLKQVFIRFFLTFYLFWSIFCHAKQLLLLVLCRRVCSPFWSLFLGSQDWSAQSLVGFGPFKDCFVSRALFFAHFKGLFRLHFWFLSRSMMHWLLFLSHFCSCSCFLCLSNFVSKKKNLFEFCLCLSYCILSSVHTFFSAYSNSVWVKVA